MPQSSKSLIIAVVEDDPRIGELIREEICDEGHIFQGFITAESFLEEVNELKPDLVLLDLMLPGIDGLECLQRLRQMPLSPVLPTRPITSPWRTFCPSLTYSYERCP